MNARHHIMFVEDDEAHRSVQDAEAVRIREVLARYCEGREPDWRRGQG